MKTARYKKVLFSFGINIIYKSQIKQRNVAELLLHIAKKNNISNNNYVVGSTRYAYSLVYYYYYKMSELIAVDNIINNII